MNWQSFNYQFDEWEGVPDTTIEEYAVNPRIPYVYCQLEHLYMFENLHPCDCTVCPHHVSPDGLEFRGVRETEQTRAFFNCMFLITSKHAMSQPEIGRLLGVTRQAVKQTEDRLLQKLLPQAKEMWPGRYRERGKASKNKGGNGDGSRPSKEKPTKKENKRYGYRKAHDRLLVSVDRQADSPAADQGNGH